MKSFIKPLHSNITDIYEVQGTKITKFGCIHIKCEPIWIFDKFGPLVAGSNPIQTIKTIALKPIYRDSLNDAKSIANAICLEFSRARLGYISSKWIRIYDDGKVEWMKNRGADYSNFPFKTLEELQIFSDLHLWPKPMWLDDIADAVAKDLLSSRV